MIRVSTPEEGVLGQWRFSGAEDYSSEIPTFKVVYSNLPCICKQDNVVGGTSDPTRALRLRPLCYSPFSLISLSVIPIAPMKGR